jgi:hypothetical protein
MFTENSSKQIGKYNLDQVAVQEVRWDEGGSLPAIIHFSVGIEVLMIT